MKTRGEVKPDLFVFVTEVSGGIADIAATVTETIRPFETSDDARKWSGLDMTRKLSATGFNKLLAADVTLLSRDRLLGLLKLDTDTGPISLVMNKLIAERLMETLIEFLQAGAGDDAPSFVVERVRDH